MRKHFTRFTMLGLLMILAGCASWIDRGESITVVGSSALQPLAETAAESFQTNNPGRFINVQGGGSGTGLSQVQAGAVQIGNSDVFAEEKNGVDADLLVSHKVATVGITPIVNNNVGITNLALEDLRDIFTGKITNWKEVGGKDQKIVLLNRANGSGTRNTFERWVLDGQTVKQSQEQDSSGMVRQIVADTPGAISYVSFSYVTDEITPVSIDGVAPTDENVMKNERVNWSYELIYTNR